MWRREKSVSILIEYEYILIVSEVDEQKKNPSRIEMASAQNNAIESKFDFNFNE